MAFLWAAGDCRDALRSICSILGFTRVGLTRAIHTDCRVPSAFSSTAEYCVVSPVSLPLKRGKQAKGQSFVRPDKLQTISTRAMAAPMKSGQRGLPGRRPACEVTDSP